jgi:hypothetical protein
MAAPIPPMLKKDMTEEDWVKHLKSIERNMLIEFLLYLAVCFSAGAFLLILGLIYLGRV